MRQSLSADHLISFRQPEQWLTGVMSITDDHDVKYSSTGNGELWMVIWNRFTMKWLTIEFNRNWLNDQSRHSYVNPIIELIMPINCPIHSIECDTFLLWSIASTLMQFQARTRRFPTINVLNCKHCSVTYWSAKSNHLKCSQTSKIIHNNRIKHAGFTVMSTSRHIIIYQKYCHHPRDTWTLPPDCTTSF